jgi:hypothetical protein
MREEFHASTVREVIASSNLSKRDLTFTSQQYAKFEFQA